MGLRQCLGKAANASALAADFRRRLAELSAPGYVRYLFRPMGQQFEQ